ncbi:DoxX family protein [Macrococcoides canis]|uniref:DoxX family protein n=1 Tax=Macrococcoides canis TaxID=1855823 RepID=UPI0020B64774|nr:DoxX family protein [Macrococcus canis]UTH00057.1 DoxX family protein [Macrococcus canis]
MIHWLQKSKVASVILLFLRLYLGFQWLMSGIGKFTKGFDATGYLKGVTAHPVESMAGGAQYPFYVSFLENVVTPMGKVVNILIPVLEVAVGLMLILGLFASVGSLIGMTLNFLFLFAGTISVNPLFILISIFIFMGGYNAGVLGVDRVIGRKVDSKFMRFFNYYPDRTAV